ncbi:MAG: polysaccharide biosynthesis protein [Clostridia bacterium]|nr:polysaccharide biosynthesis protein [Clostridia bacterium]
MAGKSQIKLGIILSYGQMFLHIIISLLYTPIMIRLLGQSEYGLYNTVSSTITMLSVLSLGFNSGYIRYYAKYKKNSDTESIYKLNGLFFTIFLVIGLIALLCGLFLTFNLNLVFDKGLTQNEYETAKVLMFILTINLTISFLMSVFKNIISAHERFVFLKILSILTTVLNPLVMLPLLLLGYRSITMVAVSLGVNVIVDIIYIYYVLVKLKNKFVFKDYEKGLFKSLFAYISFIAINLIVDQLNSNVDKLLLGRLAGTSAVAVYSVGYALYSYYNAFISAISGIFAPRIHRIVNETSANQLRENLTALFIKVGRLQFLLLGLLATGIVFFGKPFIYFWAGEGYEDSYYVTILLALPSTIPFIQTIGREMQQAQNKHKFRSLVYLGMALLNLVASIFLIKLYGVIGAVIGTAISLLIANCLVMNIYYHKKCNINVLAFWKEILKILFAMIIPIACGILINLFINLYSMLNLILFIVIYTAIYVVSMWLFGMNNYEKDLIKKPLAKIFKRKQANANN